MFNVVLENICQNRAVAVVITVTSLISHEHMLYRYLSIYISLCQIDENKISREVTMNAARQA